MGFSLITEIYILKCQILNSIGKRKKLTNKERHNRFSESVRKLRGGLGLKAWIFEGKERRVW